jgi:hypothetical protein
MSEQAQMPMAVDAKEFSHLEMVEIEGVLQFSVKTFDFPAKREAMNNLFRRETDMVGSEDVDIFGVPAVPRTYGDNDFLLSPEFVNFSQKRVTPEGFLFSGGIGNRYLPHFFGRDEFNELICALPFSPERRFPVGLEFSNPGHALVLDSVDEFPGCVPCVENDIRKGNLFGKGVFEKIDGDIDFAFE